MERFRKECQDTKDELVNSLRGEECLKRQLFIEHETINRWNRFAKIYEEILNVKAKNHLLMNIYLRIASS